MAKTAKRSTLECGSTILDGKYKILELIHQSGMANVYLVSDSGLNKTWCLKEIRKSEAGKNNVEYYSLLQEANIMSKLNHSSIPRITTIQEDGDSLFIVMDYVEGLSIKNWLESKGKIRQDVVINWMKQICQVMMYLHNREKPIFYRDMKPDNVMIQSDGSIKLLDFGISLVIEHEGQKITKALGTLGYAAPEQSHSGNVCDLRSDIYAMGKTMYYMLTGVNPRVVPKDRQKSVREMDPSISIGIEKIVEKCIAENPDDRYQSCEELYYALQNYNVLDTEYRVKARKKINTVLTLLIMSLFILLTSFIPLQLEKSQEEEKYTSLVEAAYQSGRVKDFEAAIDEKPDNLSPYLDYFNAIKVDGVFSKNEEKSLLGFINPILSDIKTQDQYGEIAFNIGKLYWFYYPDSKSGMTTSVRWFEDAYNSGYDKSASKVFYDLGKFTRDISMSIAESSDGGMYAKYWSDLVKAKRSNNGELIDLQLNRAIVECINSYVFRLKQDGVKEEDILNEVKSIREYIAKTNTSNERATEILNSIKKESRGIEERIKLTYRSSGGGQ